MKILFLIKKKNFEIKGNVLLNDLSNLIINFSEIIVYNKKNLIKSFEDTKLIIKIIIL